MFDFLNIQFSIAKMVFSYAIQTNRPGGSLGSDSYLNVITL